MKEFAITIACGLALATGLTIYERVAVASSEHSAQEFQRLCDKAEAEIERQAQARKAQGVLNALTASDPPRALAHCQLAGTC